MKTLHVYQYPKCSTCRKALKWLAEHGAKTTATDLVLEPIPVAKLKDLHRRSGLPLARFFNTSGQSYRDGDFKNRTRTMSEADMLRALAADGKLVKRPIVDTGTLVLVGFDEDQYAERIP
jgi:arsenate reductase